jgi:hypothetical protein
MGSEKPHLNPDLLEVRMSPLPQGDMDVLAITADTIFR